MNAYDIAKDLDRESKFPGHICYGTSPLLVRAANMLRQLQAENEMLRKRFGEELDAHHSALRKISKLRKAQKK